MTPSLYMNQCWIVINEVLWHPLQGSFFTANTQNIIHWIMFQNYIFTITKKGHHFADDTFKRILMNENIRISIKISLKFLPKGPINNIQALVQVMAWHRPGDKPLSEPMLVSLLTHIWCVVRPQWVKCHQFQTLAKMAMALHIIMFFLFPQLIEDILAQHYHWPFGVETTLKNIMGYHIQTKIILYDIYCIYSGCLTLE